MTAIKEVTARLNDTKDQLQELVNNTKIKTTGRFTKKLAITKND